MTLVLAALIVLELARLAYALIIVPVKTPQPAAPLTAANAARAGINVQEVVDAHLFGIAVADPGSQDPAHAPPSSANLLLTGTIATDDPKHGVAIVSDGGGPSKVYAVGDRLAGASLHSVYLDHVILDRNGALETVALPRLRPAGVGAPSRRPAADARTSAAVDNIRRLVQQDPSILDQVMRTVPSFDNAAGKLRGFRAFPGRNRQIFNKLGLKSGDLVTAINGTQLDDPQRSQEVFNTIQTSDHVTVTVERGGQRQDISLNIAQVAAQASQDLDTGNGAGGVQPNGGALPGGGAQPNGGALPGGGAQSGTPLPDTQSTAPQPGAPPPDAEVGQRPAVPQSGPVPPTGNNGSNSP